jgi:leucyl-tRNA synthetase
VPDSELPLTLPEMASFEPGDDPAGCLARAADWRYFQRDGQWYARETNTMPQWAGSCWYYLRFTDPTNTAAAWSEQADKDWLPVDLYVGGQEHAVLHLLYARFWHRVLHDLGFAKDSEPFARLVHQGMILGADGEKMSKSRGNVVNPDDITAEYGADALRLYEMFMGPLEATKPWQTAQVAGVVRFRDRVHALCSRDDIRGSTSSSDTTDSSSSVVTTADPQLTALLHKTVRKVTRDIEAMAFNTAISALMVLSSALAAATPAPPRAAVEALVLMLAPFAPHVAEECWGLLGHSGSLAYEPWVQWDEALCVEATVKMGVQVNGKTRAELELAPNASEEEARAAAMALDKIKALIGDGSAVKKFIYKPGRIINIVVGK